MSTRNVLRRAVIYRNAPIGRCKTGETVVSQRNIHRPIIEHVQWHGHELIHLSECIYKPMRPPHNVRSSRTLSSL